MGRKIPNPDPPAERPEPPPGPPDVFRVRAPLVEQINTANISCSQCKHWRQEEHSKRHYMDVAEWPEYDQYGFCDRVENDFNNYCDGVALPPVGKEKAFTLDGEGYRAVLVTHGTFGCKLGEPS